MKLNVHLHPPIHTLYNYEYEVYFFCLLFLSKKKKRERMITEITLNNGCLGSRNDEERSEMRYVV